MIIFKGKITAKNLQFSDLLPGDTFRMINNAHRSQALRLKLDDDQYMNIEADVNNEFSVIYGLILHQNDPCEVQEVDVIICEEKKS